MENKKIKHSVFMKSVKNFSIFVAGALALDFVAKKMGQPVPEPFTIASFAMNYMGGSIASWLYNNTTKKDEKTTLDMLEEVSEVSEIIQKIKDPTTLKNKAKLIK